MNIADIRAYISTTSQITPACKEILLEMINWQDKLQPFQWPVPEGMKVVTRDGETPDELKKFETSKEPNSLFGVIDGVVESWYDNGKYDLTDQICSLDLFLVEAEPELVTMWVNYYDAGNGVDYAFIHNTEDRADQLNNQSGQYRIGPAIKIQFPKPKQIVRIATKNAN